MSLVYQSQDFDTADERHQCEFIELFRLVEMHSQTPLSGALAFFSDVASEGTLTWAPAAGVLPQTSESGKGWESCQCCTMEQRKTVSNHYKFPFFVSGVG